MRKRWIERRLACAAILGIVCVPAFAESRVPELPGDQRAAVHTPAPEAGADHREYDAGRQPQPPTMPAANQANSKAAGCYEKCSPPEQHEIDDLVAQQTSARAAEEMVLLGWLQFWLAAGGAFALLVTLMLTACATLAAVRANKLDKDSAERQLRAYVVVTSVRLHEAETPSPRITVIIKNTGQTPAYRLRTILCPKVTPVGREDFTYGREISKRRAVLGGGQGCAIHSRFKSDRFAATLDRIVSKEATLFAFGEIVYTDAFRAEWRTTFRFHLEHDGVLRNGPLVMSDEGNDADVE